MFPQISDEQFELFLLHYDRVGSSRYFFKHRREIDFLVLTSVHTRYGDIDIWLN